jgi:signal transduction histidine kinase
MAVAADPTGLNGADSRWLAGERAALHRVATVAAREGPPHELFAEVTAAVGLLLRAEVAALWHYAGGGQATLLGTWGDLGRALAVGSRWTLDGDSVTALVHQTMRPARLDTYASAPGAIAAELREHGVRSAVGSPIFVSGSLWGVVGAAAKQHRMPADAESRIGEFTQLVAAAIANAQARSDLAASQARIIAAADEERRRVVRDLHDGAQQRLVHTVVTLQLARRALTRDLEQARTLVAEAQHHAQTAADELRELALGILPSILTGGGLRPAVTSLCSRMSIPVDADVLAARLPPAVEAAAYFIVAEGLTNIVKHSEAERAIVTVHPKDGALHVTIRDDGVGGARRDGGGLSGIRDRVAPLGGQIHLHSPPGCGTLLTVEIPLTG